VGEARRKRLAADARWKASIAASTPSVPVTLMGLLLKASMLRWEDERVRRLREVKEAGSKHGNNVVLAAFKVAVTRVFDPDVSLREISDLVARMQEAFGDVMPWMEVEALIRHLLDEDVYVDDIDVLTRVGASTLFLMAAADLNGRDETFVNSVICEAEALVWDAGLRPSLEDDSRSPESPG